MKKIITLLACMLTGSMLQAQAVPMALEDWKTTQGTQNFFYKNVTKTDVSGNVYVAGATMNNGFPDMLVAKYNAAGNLQWIQQLAGTAPNGVDAIAGMYVTGTDVYVTGAVSNNSVTPETDCMTMKLSGSTGSVLWSTTYTGAAGAHDAGKDITLDGSGNVYVSGASYNGSGNTDYLVLKYNSSGTQQWVSTWDYTGADDGGYKIALSGTNVNVTGAVTTTTPGTYKMSTIKLAQSSGSITATNTSTAVTTSSVEAVTDMALDGSGNVIIVGSQYTGGQHDFYVQKLNASTLSSVFIYTWDGGSSLDDYAKAVTTDASGNVFVAGFSSSSTLGRELTLIKLNSSGTHQWTQTSGFSGDDEAADLVTDANGDVYVAGFKTNSTKDYYTAKYSTGGTKIWEIEADGNSGLEDNATNMALDSLNHVIVTGQSKTGSGDYEFMTAKYVQKEVITPTDFDGETPAPNFMYYRNRGQIIAADTIVTPVPEVKFYTNNTYPSFYFGNRKQSFVFARMDTATVSASDTLHRIDLDFPTSNETAETYPLDEQENGYLNYFLAHTDSNGIANVKGNQRLITPNLYTNIDLMCSSNQNGIKYYFIVKPGGDMRDIQMEFTGASSFNLNGTTNELTINSSIGSMTFDKPIVYQLTSGNVIVPVTAWTPDWQTNGGSNKYKFNDGSYNTAQTLIIEVDQGNGVTPSSAINNLTWSTYYGGSGGEEYGYSIKQDNLGNSYIGGYSTNPSFPVTVGAYQTTYVSGDNSNGILIKANASRQIQWSTFFGGSALDHIKSVAFDNISNQVYVCGYSWSADFPIKNKTGATISGAFNGYSDAFIASFNTAGQQTWSNIFGTISDERAYSIYCDNAGNKYLTGYTGNGLTQTNSAAHYMQSGFGGGTSDGFIAKYGSTDQINWMTYYGGNAEDYGMSVTGDANGNVYVWGQTQSTTFNTYDPGSGAICNTTNSGSTDFFILKFGPSGNRLWATLYGGNGDDWAAEGDGIVTVGNDVYFYGTTFSTNLTIHQYGTTPTYTLNGVQDCYIVCFNSAYTEKWATYYGGSYQEQAGGIVKDINNNILITGSTASSDFVNATPFGFYSQSFGGPLGLPTGVYAGGDAFIASFSNLTLAPVWSAFVGGGSHDVGYGISTSNNKVFITGVTLSQSQNTSYPVITPVGAYSYLPPSHTGNGDIILSEFDISNIPVSLNEIENQEDDQLIYPNPFSNLIHIEAIKGKSKYEIFDVSGRLIQSEVLKSDQNLLYLSTLKAGIYLFKVTTDNGGFKTFRIIKRD